MSMATRHVPFNPADVADLQHDQRQREVAAILAAGVIRIRVRRGTASSSRRAPPASRRTSRMSQIPPESGETRLELSRRSSPDAQCG
jgi:hypothetical protein